MKAGRNRPAELPDAAKVQKTPFGDAVSEWMANQLKTGLTPRAVGEQVLGAIQQNRFYILTHPDWTPLIAQRIERAVKGENPQRAQVPGLDQLMQLLQARMNQGG
jgi:hypothetical protein